MLEDQKTDVNKVYGRETALQRAIYVNNEEIVKLLLLHGAQTEHRIPDSPWNLPIYSIIRGHFNLLDLMLEAGFNMEYGEQRDEVNQMVQ